MKKFAVCYNREIENSVSVKNELLKILSERNLDVKSLDIDGLEDGFDFVFVIGGDGTILKTARFFAKSKIPVNIVFVFFTFSFIETIKLLMLFSISVTSGFLSIKALWPVEKSSTSYFNNSAAKPKLFNLFLI